MFVATSWFNMVIDHHMLSGAILLKKRPVTPIFYFMKRFHVEK